MIIRKDVDRNYLDKMHKIIFNLCAFWQLTYKKECGILEAQGSNKKQQKWMEEIKNENH